MSQVSWEETGRAQRGYVQHNVPTRYSGSNYSRVWSWSPQSSLSGASGANRWSGQPSRLYGGAHFQAQAAPLWNVGAYWPKVEQPRLHRVSRRSESSDGDSSGGARESSYASSATLKPASWFGVIVGILVVLGISIGLVVYFTGGAGASTSNESAQENIQPVVTTPAPATTPAPPDITTTELITTEAPLVIPDSGSINATMTFAANFTEYLGNSTVEEKIIEIQNELTLQLQDEPGFIRVVVSDLSEGSVIITAEAIYNFTVALITPNATSTTLNEFNVLLSNWTIPDSSGEPIVSETIKYDYEIVNLEPITGIDNTREVITSQSITMTELADNPCQVLLQWDPDACGNGTCDANHNTTTTGGRAVAVCYCDPGWTGSYCNIEITPCTFYTDCVNGVCVVDYAATDNVTCSCDVGWEGTLCDVQTTTASPIEITTDYFDVKGTQNDATVAPPVRRRRAAYNADGRKGDVGFELPDGLVYIVDPTFYDDLKNEQVTEEYTPWNVGFKGRIFDKQARLLKENQNWELKGHKMKGDSGSVSKELTYEYTQDRDLLKRRMKGEQGESLAFHEFSDNIYNKANYHDRLPDDPPILNQVKR